MIALRHALPSAWGLQRLVAASRNHESPKTSRIEESGASVSALRTPRRVDGRVCFDWLSFHGRNSIAIDHIHTVHVLYSSPPALEVDTETIQETRLPAHEDAR